MKESILKSFAASGIFFCLGVLALIMGFNGKSVAIFFSGLLNNSSWYTSDAMIDGFTYIPISIGVFLLIITIVTFTMTLNNAQKK